MAISSLQNQPRRNRQHSEGPAAAATSPPTRSSTPNPEIALPGPTHHQPGSPCSLSDAPGLRLPHPAPPFNMATSPPQPGSIQAIIREKCRSRLYVAPIAWTSDQPRLLGCRFVFKQPQTSQKQDDAEIKSATHQPQERIVAATRLARPGMASWRKVAVEELLEAYNIRSLGFDSTLPFRFGGRVVASIKTDGIFSAGSTAPFLAYINLQTVNALRQKYAFSRFGRRHSTPVATLRQKKLRLLQPPHKAQDPYIVAALIALAQEQQLRSDQTTSGGAAGAHTESSGTEKTETSLHGAASFKVHVLVVPGPRAGALYVYKASIPQSFLDNLKSPSRFSPSCPIPVSCHAISLINPEEIVEQIPRVLKVPPGEQAEQDQRHKPGTLKQMVAFYRRVSR